MIFVVYLIMKNKKLSHTNQYLKNPIKRQVAVATSVCSSSAIEGIAAQEIIADIVLKKSSGSTSHDIAKNKHTPDKLVDQVKR
jgi:hypothetical protein